MLRPDWPVNSLVAYLAKTQPNRPYQDLAVALVYIAVDPETKTPARLAENGPWWKAALAGFNHGQTVARVGPDVGEERCRYAGHEHESAARCRLCAAERAAGDVPEERATHVPPPPAIVELANRHRTRVRAGSGVTLARDFAQPDELREPDAFNVTQCAKPHCGGYFVRDPAGYQAHKTVFGHDPVVPPVGRCGNCGATECGCPDQPEVDNE